MATNRLTMPQSTKLIQWLMNNANALANKTPIQVKLQAEKELGFIVHDKRISKTCEELKIPLAPSRLPSKDKTIKKLLHNQKLLIQAVSNIYNTLELVDDLNLLQSEIQE